MPTSASQLNQLRATLEKVKHFLSGGGGKLSEADTRAHFVDPLVAALGYTAFNDVKREFFVKDTKDFLDYVLSVNGDPRVAIEAKPIHHDLTDGDAGQLIQYCSIVGIEWAALTNGVQFWLYHQFATAALAGKLVFKLSLAAWNSEAEFRSLAAQILLLSKEAFVDSDGPAAWVRAQKLDGILREALTNPRSQEVKWLRQRLASQEVKVSPEDIAAWAKAKLIEPTPAPTPELYHAMPPSAPTPIATPVTAASGASDAGPSRYWMLPASPRKGMTATQCLKYWLDSGKWGLYESTPQRTAIRPGDRIAFYATSEGVVARATAAGSASVLITADEWPEPTQMDKPVYRLPLSAVEWLSSPVAITAQVRSELDAFHGKNLEASWSWLVQTTRQLSKRDFDRLTSNNRS